MRLNTACILVVVLIALLGLSIGCNRVTSQDLVDSHLEAQESLDEFVDVYLHMGFLIQELCLDPHNKVICDKYEVVVKKD